MPIVISCSSCKARLNAPDTAMGKTVKCPKCQTAIKVGGGSSPAPAPAKSAPAPAKKQAPPPDDDFDFDKQSAPKKKGRDDYDDDYDDRPAAKKKGRDDYDDYDDRPAKKKGRDDYSDEPPSKSKGRRDDRDDRDYDDQPRSKKKGKGSPGGSVSEKDRNDAFMVYVAAIIGSFIGIGPLGGIIWWLMKRGESRFVDHHGKEFMNMQITNFIVILLMVALMVAGGFLGAATESPVVAFLFIGAGALFLGIFALAVFIFMLIAMFKAKAGEWYRIPVCIHFLKA